MTEKNLSKFGHNVWKGGLVNTATASFTTIAGQMTEMLQRKLKPGFREMVKSNGSKQVIRETANASHAVLWSFNATENFCCTVSLSTQRWMQCQTTLYCHWPVRLVRFFMHDLDALRPDAQSGIDQLVLVAGQSRTVAPPAGGGWRRVFHLDVVRFGAERRQGGDCCQEFADRWRFRDTFQEDVLFQNAANDTHKDDEIAVRWGDLAVDPCYLTSKSTLRRQTSKQKALDATKLQ